MENTETKEIISQQIDKWQEKLDKAYAVCYKDMLHAIKFGYHKEAAILQRLISDWSSILNSNRLSKEDFELRVKIFTGYLKIAIQSEDDIIRHEINLATLELIDKILS